MPNSPRYRHTEPPWARAALIGASVSFVGILILLPVIAVFVEAFRKGIGAYFTSIADPLALSALRLTLVTAAVSLVANLVFGLAASWTIAKFNFPGRELLPLAHRLTLRRFTRNLRAQFRPHLRRARLVRPLADQSQHSNCLCHAWSHSRHRLRDVPFCRARIGSP